MSASFSVPRHRLAFEANRLAREAVNQLGARLKRLLNKIQKFERDTQEIANLPFSFKSVCFFMTLGWIAVIIWEFLISQEFYRDFVSKELSPFFQYFPFMTIVLIAMLISVLVGEPFHPILSRFWQRNSGFTETDEILGKKPPGDKRWKFFTAGVLIAIPFTILIYFLSSHRVKLLIEVGILDPGDSFLIFAQRVLPAVLFVFEIATGVFVIYFVHILWYWIGTRLLEKSFDRLNWKIQETKQAAIRLWEAYRRDWERANREQNGNEVSQPISPCPELLQILHEQEPSMNGHSAPSPESNNGQNAPPKDPHSEDSDGDIAERPGHPGEAPQNPVSDAPENGKSTDVEELRRLLDERNRRNQGDL
ncbi:MAG: hypothetical protein Q9P90_04650 [candidate division KSB1 bacterium]|nr:hypothetical protein [candidate division KSB1 bacterium]